MTTTIYLIRHGEVYNPKGILYGRLPRYALSEKGKKEIAKTAAFLADKPIDAVYSSPLLRAYQTAEIIRSQFKLSVTEISKSLFEVKTSYQGQLFTTLSPDQSEVYIKPDKEAGDETIEQIAKRMHRFIERLGEIHPGKHFVAISHGDPIMALQAIVKNLPLTFPSIRTGKEFSYIRHGEVLEVQISKDKSISVKSIFIPEV